MQSFIFKHINKIKKRQNLLIFLTVVYLIGIILGVIFSNKTLCSNVLSHNLNKYYFLVFDVSINAFKPLFNCLLTGISLTLAVIVFGFSSITIYLFSIVIFYRGLILGTSLILFYSLSSISGVLIFIILTLPTNVLITAGLIICNVLNEDVKTVCEFKNKLKKIISNSIISLIFTIIASIYFIFLLITVIRPINMLF